MGTIDHPGVVPVFVRNGRSHGTRSSYFRGCRCCKCKEADQAYKALWRRRRRAAAMGTTTSLDLSAETTT
jgi:hypothetical protein